MVVQRATLIVHLRRARDHIDRRYAEPLDLEAFARAAHVSSRHFSRSFRRVFGETPYQYLLTRRLERARYLLRTTDRSVAEICHAIGFTSLGSFSSRFRQMVGESPTAYRDRWAARGGAHVPGCFLFVRGVLDPAETGPIEQSGRSPEAVRGSTVLA